MARKEIRIPLDRENRNDVNSNFKELYDQLHNITGTITDEIIQEILEESLRDSKLIWKEFVDTYDDLPAEADTGDVHYVVEDETFYRWDGEYWTPIQEIDLSYIDEIDSRLNQKITDNYNELDSRIKEKADISDLETVESRLNRLDTVVTVDDLPKEGIVSAHRGGGLYSKSPVAADNAFSGFDMAIRLGAHIIDVDARRTGDGTFIAMHDRSVARTTDGRGYVTNLVSSALPNVDVSDVCGSGWPKEPVPTIEEILVKYGGRVIITIEPKEGMSAIKPLADLIKAYKLERSVFINTNKFDVAEEIVSQGCLAHVYGCDTVAKVENASTVGAWLIEVPHDASSAIVNTALNSDIQRTIAKPIWTIEQVKEMSEGLQGHVTDAIGITNKQNLNERLVDTIKGSLMANKRGVGWRFEGEWEIDNEMLVFRDFIEQDGASVYLGDVSGIGEGFYSITYKIIPSDKGSDTAGYRIRICASSDSGKGFDSDTDGYVCNIRKNGQINLWTSSGDFGGGILLGETDVNDSETTPLVEGREYTIITEITPTTIKMTREDTGQVIGPFQNTDWRGGHIYAWMTRGALDSAFTDVRVEENI